MSRQNNPQEYAQKMANLKARAEELRAQRAAQGNDPADKQQRQQQLQQRRAELGLVDGNNIFAPAAKRAPPQPAPGFEPLGGYGGQQRPPSGFSAAVAPQGQAYGGNRPAQMMSPSSSGGNLASMASPRQVQNSGFPLQNSGSNSGSGMGSMTNMSMTMGPAAGAGMARGQAAQQPPYYNTAPAHQTPAQVERVVETRMEQYDDSALQGRIDTLEREMAGLRKQNRDLNSRLEATAADLEQALARIAQLESGAAVTNIASILSGSSGRNSLSGPSAPGGPGSAQSQPQTQSRPQQQQQPPAKPAPAAAAPAAAKQQPPAQQPKASPAPPAGKQLPMSPPAKSNAPAAASRAPPTPVSPPPNEYEDDGGDGDYDVGNDEVAIGSGSAMNISEKGSAGPLKACPHCDRKFQEKAWAKHVKSKVCQKKRKVFDVTAKRLDGVTDESGRPVDVRVIKKKVEALDAKEEEKKKKPAKWKQDRDKLRAAMQAGKQLAAAIAAGVDIRDLPPPAATAPEDDDRMECPHCNRKFAQQAAERHIPKCSSMKHNKPAPAAAPAKSGLMSKFFGKK